MDLGLPYTSLIESLENQVEQGLFTAWSCAHKNGALSAFFADEAAPPEWLLDQNSDLHPHQKSPVYWMPPFDLASLSKPLLANAWLRLKLGTDPLLWTGAPLGSLLQPRSPEGELLKRWCDAQAQLTLADLINHTSGLKPWAWFGRALWKQPTDQKDQRNKAVSRSAELQADSSGDAAVQARLELTATLLQQPAQGQSNKRETIYSDINYYLLARVIENLGMIPFPGWSGVISELNDHWQSNFWHASLDPERSQRSIPYYSYIHSQVVAHLYENRKLTNHAGEFGAVHDTNANILATEFRTAAETSPLVSGHAGVFGSVFDVMRTVEFFVSSQNDLNASGGEKFDPHQRFQWGFDTPSAATSTAGLNHWPVSGQRKIFGHLGYTGTSLWMADDGQFHTLLTNRTASRKVLGSAKVPRILIFQKDQKSEPLCWLRWANQPTSTLNSGWQPITWQDAYALCVEQNRMVTRYWDRQTLRKPPDLSEVRRSSGRLLWSH